MRAVFTTDNTMAAIPGSAVVWSPCHPTTHATIAFLVYILLQSVTSVNFPKEELQGILRAAFTTDNTMAAIPGSAVVWSPCHPTTHATIAFLVYILLQSVTSVNFLKEETSDLLFIWRGCT